MRLVDEPSLTVLEDEVDRGVLLAHEDLVQTGDMIVDHLLQDGHLVPDDSIGKGLIHLLDQ